MPVTAVFIGENKSERVGFIADSLKFNTDIGKTVILLADEYTFGLANGYVLSPGYGNDHPVDLALEVICSVGDAKRGGGSLKQDSRFRRRREKRQGALLGKVGKKDHKINSACCSACRSLLKNKNPAPLYVPISSYGRDTFTSSGQKILEVERKALVGKIRRRHDKNSHIRQRPQHGGWYDLRHAVRH